MKSYLVVEFSNYTYIYFPATIDYRHIHKTHTALSTLRADANGRDTGTSNDASSLSSNMLFPYQFSIDHLLHMFLQVRISAVLLGCPRSTAACSDIILLLELPT